MLDKVPYPSDAHLLVWLWNIDGIQGWLDPGMRPMLHLCWPGGSVTGVLKGRELTMNIVACYLQRSQKLSSSSKPHMRRIYLGTVYGCQKHILNWSNDSCWGNTMRVLNHKLDLLLYDTLQSEEITKTSASHLTVCWPSMFWYTLSILTLSIWSSKVVTHIWCGQGSIMCFGLKLWHRKQWCRWKWRRHRLGKPIDQIGQVFLQLRNSHMWSSTEVGVWPAFLLASDHLEQCWLPCFSPKAWSKPPISKPTTVSVWSAALTHLKPGIVVPVVLRVQQRLTLRITGFNVVEVRSLSET